MKKIIIANWKMNPGSLAKAEGLFDSVKEGIERIKDLKNVEVIICPPFVYLERLSFKTRRSLVFRIQLGAQDCHWEQSGAFTGEVSPKMLKSLGCKYIIIGHSERRKYFKETDEIINKKLKAVLKAGLGPVLCIGEKKGENSKKIISGQLKKDLAGISKKDLNKIIIAYEPVWAISTSGGEICSPEYAQKMLGFVRQRSSGIVIYGGSVDSKIINNYLGVGYDGALVGGASLKAGEFIKIVRAVKRNA